MLSLRNPFCTALLTLGATLIGADSSSAQDAQQAEALLKRLDGNGDGVISPGEVSPRGKVFFDRLAEKADMDASQPISIEKMVRRLSGEEEDRDDSRFREREDDDDRRRDYRDRYRRRGDDEGDDRRRRNDDEQPLVPGFGEVNERVAPPGFGADAALALVSVEDRYDERVIRYVERILDRYDRNDNDILDADEWEAVRWSSDPKESDLNNDGRLTKAELCERIAQRYGGRSDDDDDDDRRGSRDGRSSSSSSSSSSTSDRYKKYAEALLKQNDKNGNGVLEKDEWNGLRGSTREADVNNDDVITVAELTAKLSNYAKGDSSSSSRESSSSSSNDRRERYSRYSSSRSRYGRSDDEKDENKPAAYRFLTPTERLPRGLPDWFEEKDANGDGQVHLSEFERSINAETSANFRQYDLNDDGYVTPQECLEAAERKAG